MEVSVTAGKTVSLTELIVKNPELYYGKKVSNYTAGGKTYRIFYVDKTGKFGVSSLGSGENTIYLKADWTDDNTNLWGFNSYTPKSTLVLEKMNSIWWNERGLLQTSWKYSEHMAAYLCDPTTASNTSNRAWSSYFDEEKANYVIGSPSIEMYVASYNDVSHTTGNYILGAEYYGEELEDYCVGYIYTVNGERKGYSVNNVLDYVDYNRLYCWQNPNEYIYYTHLASPFGLDYGLLQIYGKGAGLSGSDGSDSAGISPVVSLKSDFQIEIEEE